MIKRNLQRDLENRLKSSPAVCILGPRQVGKTTLAKLIARDENSYLYLDVENPRDLVKLSDAYTYLNNRQNLCIVLDEVQLMPELFSLLRPLIDNNRRPGRFILLGSASPRLVKGVSESLAGRISYLELTPIGFTELPENFNFYQHWFLGGFPNALLAQELATSREWVQDFTRSYIERDLAHLFGVELAPTLLRNFWIMLAHSNGNIWNAEVFARSLGVTAPTVLRYLGFLEGGYMIKRLPPWFVNAKKRIVKSPKIYVRDTGILHSLLNITRPDDLFGHPAVGASWEGYVIEQVSQMVRNNLDLFFYRTQAGAECDLVLVRGIEVIACIEIKLSNSPVVSKGFINSSEDLNPKFKYIITPESDDYTTSHGVTITNLKYFLEKYLAKL